MRSSPPPHVEIELNPSEQRLYDRMRANLVASGRSRRSGLGDLLLLLPDFVVLLARIPYTGHSRRESGAAPGAPRAGLGDFVRAFGEARADRRMTMMIVLGGATSFFVGSAAEVHPLSGKCLGTALSSALREDSEATSAYLVVRRADGWNRSAAATRLRVLHAGREFLAYRIR